VATRENLLVVLTGSLDDGGRHAAERAASMPMVTF
jgi:hypothetical protein